MQKCHENVCLNYCVVEFFLIQITENIFTSWCQWNREVFCTIANISAKSKQYAKYLSKWIMGPDGLESWKNGVQKSHDTVPLSRGLISGLCNMELSDGLSSKNIFFNPLPSLPPLSQPPTPALWPARTPRNSAGPSLIEPHCQRLGERTFIFDVSKSWFQIKNILF